MITDYDSYVKAREKLNFTDYYVSKSTGISRSTFTQWKKGEIKPSKTTLERLNRFFSNGNYKPLPQHHSSLMLGDAPIEPAFFMKAEPNVTSYMIRINEDTLMELNQEEYDELQTAVSCFMYAWFISKHKESSRDNEED